MYEAPRNYLLLELLDEEEKNREPELEPLLKQHFNISKPIPLHF